MENTHGGSGSGGEDVKQVLYGPTKVLVNLQYQTQPYYDITK